jgi:hypothetical protein
LLRKDEESDNQQSSSLSNSKRIVMERPKNESEKDLQQASQSEISSVEKEADFKMAYNMVFC